MVSPVNPPPTINTVVSRGAPFARPHGPSASRTPTTRAGPRSCPRKPAIPPGEMCPEKKVLIVAVADKRVSIGTWSAHRRGVITAPPFAARTEAVNRVAHIMHNQDGSSCRRQEPVHNSATLGPAPYSHWANQFDKGPVGILDQGEVRGAAQGDGRFTKELHLVFLDPFEDGLQGLHMDGDILHARVVLGHSAWGARPACRSSSASSPWPFCSPPA